MKKEKLNINNNKKSENQSRISIDDTVKLLKESEKKYKNLTDSIPLGIFQSTPDKYGKFIEVNSAFVKILGYKNKNELVKLNVSDIYQNPNIHEQISKILIQKGTLKNKKIKLLRKDGKPITVLLTSRFIKKSNGKISHFIGIIENITKKNNTKEELNIQKSYFENLFNSAPEAIVLHGNDDKILNVNEEFCRMFGYTKKEAIGQFINELLVSDEYKEEGVSISASVIKGNRIALSTKRKRKDGSLVDVSILGAPIIHNGKQIGDYAIYRDITEEAKFNEELLVQKTYLEELFNSAPEAIVLHDNSDCIVNVNKEFSRMFEYTKEEVIGKKINDIVASNEYKENARILSKMVLSGKPVEHETMRKRKNGDLFDVSILGAPIISNDKQMGVYAIYRDITEHKKAEETRIRIQEEAKMARKIQMNFLPKSNPEVAGYDIAGSSIPALNVGGDYYDFIWIDENRLVVIIGDVSGNGLSAAMVMANLQATIRSQTSFEHNPQKCLERANKLLYQSIDSKTFISLFYGVLDIKTNLFQYANAGQDLPIKFSINKEPTALTIHGVALGLIENSNYQNGETILEPGDTLILYTDGIIESMNEKREQFGKDRLLELVQQNTERASNKIVEDILSVAKAHCTIEELNDDMTIVIIKRKVE
ncbi:MAG: PAS domain S-box protein [Ignavibacteriales bacterium]|nr:PAS domain S-box protein [Ignavibacteriales bacterium]